MTIKISSATQLRLLARKYAPTAFATLIGIMTSEKVAPSVRQSAAIALLDRGFGRVPLMTSAESGEQGLRITEIVTTIVDPEHDDTPVLEGEDTLPRVNAPEADLSPLDADCEDDTVGE